MDAVAALGADDRMAAHDFDARCLRLSGDLAGLGPQIDDGHRHADPVLHGIKRGLVGAVIVGE